MDVVLYYLTVPCVPDTMSLPVVQSLRHTAPSDPFPFPDTRHDLPDPFGVDRTRRTLLKALLDETKPLATHYGAICGLSELGPRVTQLLILPNLKEYLAKLEPKLAEGDGDGAKDAKAGEKEAVEKRKRRQRDARRVHDLLKRAVGTCLHAAPAVPVSAPVAARRPGKRAPRVEGKGKAPTGPATDTPGAWTT